MLILCVHYFGEFELTDEIKAILISIFRNVKHRFSLLAAIIVTKRESEPIAFYKNLTFSLSIKFSPFFFFHFFCLSIKFYQQWTEMLLSFFSSLSFYLLPIHHSVILRDTWSCYIFVKKKKFLFHRLHLSLYNIYIYREREKYVYILYAIAKINKLVNKFLK